MRYWSAFVQLLVNYKDPIRLCNTTEPSTGWCHDARLQKLAKSWAPFIAIIKCRDMASFH